MHQRLEETLRRLKHERDEADRRYNDALTALDRALPQVPDLPAVAPPYDEHQLASLNSSWNIAPITPTASGVKRKIVGLIWRVVGPYFDRQRTFNSAVVDHLNRANTAQHASYGDLQGRIDALRDHLHALLTFHSQLMALAQQITPYVDTRDRDTGGKALIVNEALNKVADSMAVAQEEFRMVAAVGQRAAVAAKRELERARASDRPEVPTTPDVVSSPETRRHTEAFAPTFEAYKYVGFEDYFRGSEEMIRDRFASYLPYFAGASGVLDAGCGRGEFLDLLTERGIPARGVDLNHEMVEVCRARGLNVAEGDAVSYLQAIEDGALGGLFAAQVVEHMQASYLLRFLDLAYQKLRPGAPLVLETLNPACWAAFFDSFIRDITHVWPMHPDTLRYLVIASGFSAARIEWRSPVAEEHRLQQVSRDTGSDSADDVRAAFNANVEKLNARLFTYLDYAIVARR